MSRARGGSGRKRGRVTRREEETSLGSSPPRGGDARAARRPRGRARALGIGAIDKKVGVSLRSGGSNPECWVRAVTSVSEEKPHERGGFARARTAMSDHPRDL